MSRGWPGDVAVDSAAPPGTPATGKPLQGSGTLRGLPCDAVQQPTGGRSGKIRMEELFLSWGQKRLSHGRHCGTLGPRESPRLKCCARLDADRMRNVHLTVISGHALWLQAYASGAIRAWRAGRNGDCPTGSQNCPVTALEDSSLQPRSHSGQESSTLPPVTT